MFLIDEYKLYRLIRDRRTINAKCTSRVVMIGHAATATDL